MLGDIRLLSVGRRSLSMDEKSMSGCSLTDEARQAAEAKLSPDGDGPRMYGARRIKSTSELEAGRPLGRQYLSPSTKAVGALAVPKSGGANDSDVLFVTILEVLDLAPMQKERRMSLLSSPWSSSKKKRAQQLEAAVHLALQLGSTRRRTDDICTPSLAAVKCCGGTGRVDEEFVFDVPEGTDALLVTGLARQFHGRRSQHSEFVVGSVKIPVDRLPEGSHVEQWYSLKASAKDDTNLKAAVKLRLRLVVRADPSVYATASPMADWVRYNSAGSSQPTDRNSSPSEAVNAPKTTAQELAAIAAAAAAAENSLHEEEAMSGGKGSASNNAEPRLSQSKSMREPGDATAHPVRAVAASVAPPPGPSPLNASSSSMLSFSSAVKEPPQQPPPDAVRADAGWWRRQVIASGLIDFIAVVRGGAQVVGPDGIARPEAAVVERWPLGDAADGAEFPQKVEWFCFPGGWAPVKGRVTKQEVEAGATTAASSTHDDETYADTGASTPRSEKPPSRLVTFSVQIGGTRAWGVCLIDHELRWRAKRTSPGGKQHNNEASSTNHNKSAGASMHASYNDQSFLSPTHPSNTAAADDDSMDEWWWPVGVCVLTRQPLVTNLTAWLSELHDFLSRSSAPSPPSSSSLPSRAIYGSSSSDIGGSNVPRNKSLASVLAPWLVQVCVTLPRPVENVLAVQLQRPFGEQSRPLRIDVVSPFGLPAFGFDLKHAVSLLGPAAFVNLLEAALGERKLLLFSSDIASLTPVAEAVCCLLYPLQWSHAYVPVLPRVMLEILEAPQPYIVGVHSAWLEEVPSQSLEDVVMVDIDAGSVEPYEGSTRALIARARVEAAAEANGWGPLPLPPLGPPPVPPPPTLPHAVSTNIVGLLSDFVQLTSPEGDGTATDEAGALLMRGRVVSNTPSSSSTSSEIDNEGNSNDGDYATTLDEGSTRDLKCGVSAGTAELRLAMAAQIAGLLAGFEQCVFWVDAGWPVFDEARFLEEFTHPDDAPAAAQLVATQTFHQLLENFDDPDLVPFLSLVHATDLTSKRRVGAAGLGLASRYLPARATSADPATHRSRVTMAAKRGTQAARASRARAELNRRREEDKKAKAAAAAARAKEEAAAAAAAAAAEQGASGGGGSGLAGKVAGKRFARGFIDHWASKAGVQTATVVEPSTEPGTCRYLLEVNSTGGPNGASCDEATNKHESNTTSQEETSSETTPTTQAIRRRGPRRVGSIAGAAAMASTSATNSSRATGAASGSRGQSISPPLPPPFGFPREALLLISSLDAAAAAVATRSSEAFNSAHDADAGGGGEEPERTDSASGGLGHMADVVVRAAGAQAESSADPARHGASGAGGSGKFRFKSIVPPRAEEADVWTVAMAASASGIPLHELVDPPRPTVAGTSAWLQSANTNTLGQASSESDNVDNGVGLTASVAEAPPPPPALKQKGSPPLPGSSDSTLVRKMPRRALSENLSKAAASNDEEENDNNNATPTGMQSRPLINRRPSLVSWGRAESAEDMLAGGRGHQHHVPLPDSNLLNDVEGAAEEEEANEEEELSYAEQQLLRCVALALSTTEGPPLELLKDCEASMVEEEALVSRLVKVLTRMRRHASRVGHQRAAAAAARGLPPSTPSLGGGSSAASSSSLGGRGLGGGASDNPAGHRLPCVGFETLAALCHAALKACAARHDFAPPYALLQLTGAYYQRVRVRQHEPESSPERQVEPTDGDVTNSAAATAAAVLRSRTRGTPSSGFSASHGGPEEEIEYLSARLCEHHVYSDLRLWEHVLSADLERCAPTMLSPFATPNNKKVPTSTNGFTAKSATGGGAGRGGASTPPMLGTDAAAASFVTPNVRPSTTAAAGATEGALTNHGLNSAMALAGAHEFSVSEKRLVVQRVTFLLYSMRGIGMTPHRAVLLVRNVVAAYQLSHRQWRQLHAVVCSVWRDAALPSLVKLNLGAVPAPSPGNAMATDYDQNRPALQVSGAPFDLIPRGDGLGSQEQQQQQQQGLPMVSTPAFGALATSRTATIATNDEKGPMSEKGSSFLTPPVMSVAAAEYTAFSANQSHLAFAHRATPIMTPRRLNLGPEDYAPSRPLLSCGGLLGGSNDDYGNDGDGFSCNFLFGASAYDHGDAEYSPSDYAKADKLLTNDKGTASTFSSSGLEGAALSLVAPESRGTLTCLALWGDVAVFGGTDKAVRAVHLPPTSSSSSSTSAQTQGRSSNSGGASGAAALSSSLVLTRHDAAVTAVAMVSPYAVSADASGQVRVMQPRNSSDVYDDSNSNNHENTVNGHSSSSSSAHPSLGKWHEATCLNGHTTAVTCLGLPRTAASGSIAPSVHAPPGLSVPLVASGALDGSIRVWNLNLGSNAPGSSAAASAWAIFEPPPSLNPAAPPPPGSTGKARSLTPASSSSAASSLPPPPPPRLGSSLTAQSPLSKRSRSAAAIVIDCSRAVSSLQMDSWGRFLASGSADGFVRLWDIEKESCVGALLAHAANVRCARFKGGNNNRLLSVSNDRTAVLSDPRVRPPGPGQGSAASATSISYGAATTGSGLGQAGGLVRFHGHAAPVTCLCEGAEGDPVFFTGSSDTRVLVWDMRTAKVPLWTWEGHADSVVAVRSFGSIAVSAGQDGTVCEWDVATGQLRNQRDVPAPVVCAESTGPRFAVATWAQHLHTWNHVDNSADTISGLRSQPAFPSPRNKNESNKGNNNGKGGSANSTQPPLLLGNNDASSAAETQFMNASSPAASAAVAAATAALHSRGAATDKSSGTGKAAASSQQETGSIPPAKVPGTAEPALSSSSDIVPPPSSDATSSSAPASKAKEKLLRRSLKATTASSSETTPASSSSSSSTHDPLAPTPRVSAAEKLRAYRAQALAVEHAESHETRQSAQRELVASLTDPSQLGRKRSKTPSVCRALGPGGNNLLNDLGRGSSLLREEAPPPSSSSSLSSSSTTAAAGSEVAQPDAITRGRSRRSPASTVPDSAVTGASAASSSATPFVSRRRRAGSTDASTPVVRSSRRVVRSRSSADATSTPTPTAASGTSEATVVRSSRRSANPEALAAARAARAARKAAAEANETSVGTITTAGEKAPRSRRRFVPTTAAAANESTSAPVASSGGGGGESVPMPKAKPPTPAAEVLARESNNGLVTEKSVAAGQKTTAPLTATSAGADSSSFAVFLAGAKLSSHVGALQGAGYVQASDVDAATDDALVAVGLKKPEVKRLRRYLAKELHGE